MPEWSSYREYLQSKEWKAKRQHALRRAKDRCQLCNTTKRLQVHHRVYSDWGKEPVEDLTVLCARCHKVTTKAIRKDVVRRKKHKQKSMAGMQKKVEPPLCEKEIPKRTQAELREIVKNQRNRFFDDSAMPDLN